MNNYDTHIFNIVMVTWADRPLFGIILMEDWLLFAMFGD